MLRIRGYIVFFGTVGLSILAIASMLVVIFVLAPDGPLFNGQPMFVISLMHGGMPDFPNDPISPLFALAVVSLTGLAAVSAGVAAWVSSRALRQPALHVVASLSIGPILVWLVVVVLPLMHRVIRDWNPGFTRTDLISYMLVIGAWVAGASVTTALLKVRDLRSAPGPAPT